MAAASYLYRQSYSECDGEPIYRKSDLQKHKTIETGVWVAFKDGVYDITDFVKKHPGGSEKLMLGAGSNIEHFWAFYPFHMKEHVLKLLETYRIGTLHPDDRVREEDIPKFDGVQQTLHSKNLNVLQTFPLIAETSSKSLVSSFITPNSEFFIRAH